MLPERRVRISIHSDLVRGVPDLWRRGKSAGTDKGCEDGGDCPKRQNSQRGATADEYTTPTSAQIRIFLGRPRGNALKQAGVHGSVNAARGGFSATSIQPIGGE